MTEKKENIEYPTTPEMDSHMKVEDVASLDLRAAKRKLVALKKNQRKIERKINAMESKNPAFGVTRQEKRFFEIAEKELKEAQDKKLAELEIERKQITFDAKRASYNRTFDKLSEAAKINFIEYCRLSDSNEHHKALISALEAKVETKKTSKRKALSILGSLLILGGVVGYFASNNDKEAKPTQAKIEHVANQSGQGNVAQEQASVPEAGDQKNVEIIDNFNKAITKYPPRTQEAMRMSIEWLKKYNVFTKARATNDNLSRMQASLEMQAYQDAIQQLDNNVWFIVNDRMGPNFVQQDKEHPGMTFDLSPVYQLLPTMYDQMTGYSKNSQVIQKQMNER